MKLPEIIYYYKQNLVPKCFLHKFNKVTRDLQLEINVNIFVQCLKPFRNELAKVPFVLLKSMITKILYKNYSLKALMGNYFSGNLPFSIVGVGVGV